MKLKKMIEKVNELNEAEFSTYKLQEWLKEVLKMIVDEIGNIKDYLDE